MISIDSNNPQAYNNIGNIYLETQNQKKQYNITRQQLN